MPCCYHNAVATLAVRLCLGEVMDRLMRIVDEDCSSDTPVVKVTQQQKPQRQWLLPGEKLAQRLLESEQRAHKITKLKHLIKVHKTYNDPQFVEQLELQLVQKQSWVEPEDPHVDPKDDPV